MTLRRWRIPEALPMPTRSTTPFAPNAAWKPLLALDHIRGSAVPPPRDAFGEHHGSGRCRREHPPRRLPRMRRKYPPPLLSANAQLGSSIVLVPGFPDGAPTPSSAGCAPASANRGGAGPRRALQGARDQREGCYCCPWGGGGGRLACITGKPRTLIQAADGG